MVCINRAASPTYSDHLPLVAKFRIQGHSGGDWVEIKQPGREGDEAVIRVALHKEMAVVQETGEILQQFPNLGRLFLLNVEVLELEPLSVRSGDEEFPVWIPTENCDRPSHQLGDLDTRSNWSLSSGCIEVIDNSSSRKPIGLRRSEKFERRIRIKIDELVIDTSARV